LLSLFDGGLQNFGQRLPSAPKKVQQKIEANLLPKIVHTNFEGDNKSDS
jgi:hypothetical protein